MLIYLIYNEPLLALDEPDRSQEAGVLEAVEAVAVALAGAGHTVETCGLRRSVLPLIDRAERDIAPDVVVNLCESFAGQSRAEPHIAAVCEMLGWPYTGSPPECLSLVRDKGKTKWLLQGAGVPTAPFLRIAADEVIDEQRVAAAADWLPAFIKPAAEDASLGIGPESVVHELPVLVRQAKEIQSRYGEVLVEKFLSGREFNAAVIELPQPMLLPLAEIDFQTSAEFPFEIVTYRAKWDPASPDDRATPVRCPADVDPALAKQLEEHALAAYRATGCRDYARFDFRTDDAGQVYLLEVNANPDLSPSAGLARALKVAGIEYADFVRQMVEHTYARGPAWRD